MIRTQTVMEVRILQDPVEGWGHTADDHVKWLQAHLESLISWYKPRVRLLVEETVDDTDL